MQTEITMSLSQDDLLAELTAIRDEARKLVERTDKLISDLHGEPIMVTNRVNKVRMDKVYLLDTPLVAIQMSCRSAKILDQTQSHDGRIRYLGELVQRSEEAILKRKNMGRKSLNELKEILTEFGLSFGMDVGDWTPPSAYKKDEEPFLG